VEAGLVTVVAPATEEDRETARGAVAASRLDEVVLSAGTSDTLAREILTRLEISGRLGRSQGLTGGEGI